MSKLDKKSSQIISNSNINSPQLLSNNIQIISPNSNLFLKHGKWLHTKEPYLDRVCYGHSSVIYENKLYIIGGCNAEGKFKSDILIYNFGSFFSLTLLSNFFF